MLINWINFALIGHLILVEASKLSKDLNIDDVIKSKTPCIDDRCIRISEEKNHEFTEETNKLKQDTSTRKQEDEIQPNVFDLVKLLSQLAKNENKGKTKISLSVRDIQSGFHNAGSKYHVGNIHKERNRDKRDTESTLDDTIANENGMFDLALTTETSTNFVQTEGGSKELVTQTSTVNYQANNDNKSVDINVVHAEADNFQDFNVTNNYDSITNDSTTASIDKNEEIDLKMGINGSEVQVPITVSNNVGSNVTVLLVDNDLNSNLTSTSESDGLGISNELTNEEKVINESYFQSPTNPLPLPKVKIALSKKDLNNIQNALSDDLGIKSKDATSVANFSLNGPVDKDKDNAVIVLVYNCSCGNKDIHSQDNVTGQDVDGSGSTNNILENTFDSRRMLSNDELVFSSLQTEVTPEVTIPENSLKVYNTRKVDDEINNALLENELLQKCNSLFSMQKTNKPNETSDTLTDSLGEGSLSLNKTDVPSGENVNYYNDTQISQSNVSSNTDNLTIAENFETEINSVSFNNGTEVQSTPANNISSSSQLPINNEANDSKTVVNSNTDIVDQAVTLINDNLKTAVNNEPFNLDSVVKENLLSKRKRRSTTKNSINSLQTTSVYRKKRDVTDVINEILQYFMSVPNNSTKDSALKSNDTNEKVIKARNHGDQKPKSQTNGKLKKNKNDERKRRSVRRDLLKTHRNQRSKRNIINYIKKHYVTEPIIIADDYKKSEDGVIITKRQIRSSRHPKYYDYTNTGKNLLEPDSKSDENDGTIVNFKSVSDDDAVNDDDNLKAVKQDNKDNNFVFYKENLPSNNEDILKLFSIKPIYINVYLQLLMKNFGKDMQNDN